MIKELLNNRKVNYVITTLFVLACPVFSIFFANYIIRGGLMNTLDYMGNKLLQASIAYIPMLIISIIITLVFRKVVVAYITIGGISLMGACAYYFKMLYRGEVLWPSDVVFASAAGSMMKDFNIALTGDMKKAFAALVVFVAVSAFFTLPRIKGKYKNNLTLSVVFVILLGIDAKVCFLNQEFYDSIESFSYISNPTNIYYRNTFHTAFLFYINNTIVVEPEGYSQNKIDEILVDVDTEEKIETNPDIILILLESYFDPNRLFGLEYSQPINENYNTVSEKAVYGNMLSFKYGGGTADIEFNILNQINTTNFTEALSYMNVYGGKILPSFLQTLKAEGYRTFAMHAYTSQLYNRITAYKNMGFDGSRFVDSYQNASTYGSYVSDIDHVDEMISKYEEYRSAGDESIFMYGVSMQNHMYMSQDITDRIYLENKGYSQEFTEGMEILGSYMRQTDLAIKRLYDYFENVDREVVIILYGDHQSYNIEGIDGYSSASLNEIESYNGMTSKEKYIASHTTPFIMWSNRQDMAGQYWPLVSPHNLWALASESFGLPATEYEQYLYSKMQEMPVDNNYAGIWCDKDGKIYEERPATADDIYMLNYDRLFGKQFSINAKERTV